MVGLLGGSLGGCEMPTVSRLPPGLLGVAHRAALALVLQVGDTRATSVPAGDHIAELQGICKNWTFGNSSTTAYWCPSFCAFALSEGALTHFLIHQTRSKCHLW